MPDNNSTRYADHHLPEKSSKIVSRARHSLWVLFTFSDFRQHPLVPSNPDKLEPNSLGHRAASVDLHWYIPSSRIDHELTKKSSKIAPLGAQLSFFSFKHLK
jgi:hypothetical protein